MPEVGDSHLERVAAVPMALGDREVGLQQARRDVLAAVRRVDAQVHEVPHVDEHVGDEIADDAPAVLADETDARLACQLAAEDGERPGQREGARLERGDGLEIGELHGPHDALAEWRVGDDLQAHGRASADGAAPCQRAASGARP